MPAIDFQSWQRSGAHRPRLPPAASSLYSKLPPPGDLARWSEWLSAASRQPSPIEVEAREEVRHAVEAAVQSHPELRQQVLVYTKGSIANGTNVCAGSDLDIAVEWRRDPLHGRPGDLEDRRYVREANTPRLPSPQSFRNWIIDALKRDSLLYKNLFLVGDKSIKIEPSTPATDAIARSLYVDVVPCYTLDWRPDEQPLRRGIRLFSASGRIIDNWPEQHAVNSKAKQLETRRRYKKIVRALKTIRHHFVLIGRCDPDRLKGFTVESLVWNAPTALFGHVDLYDDLAAVTMYLHGETSEPWRCGGWTEADGFGRLFRPAKREPEESHRFLSAVIEVAGIDRASAIWDYSGAYADSASLNVA